MRSRWNRAGDCGESCRSRNNPGWFVSSISSVLQIVWRHTKPYPIRLCGRFRRLSPNLQLVLHWADRRRPTVATVTLDVARLSRIREASTTCFQGGVRDAHRSGIVAPVASVGAGGKRGTLRLGQRRGGSHPRFFSTAETPRGVIFIPKCRASVLSDQVLENGGRGVTRGSCACRHGSIRLPRSE